jgi:hypothetical protein
VRIDIKRKNLEAYNVTYTGSYGQEYKVGTVAFTDKRGRRHIAGVGVFENPSHTSPLFYKGSLSSRWIINVQQVTVDLSGELLTALNFLHKPSRGQRTRPLES